MNILIISFDADPPHYGGVATMTNLLAKELIEKGHTCCLGYPDKTEYPSLFFKDKILLSTNNINGIKEFSQKHKFDIILSQFININYKLISLLKAPHTKVISVYHSRPMLHGLQLEGLIKIMEQNNNWLYKLYTAAKIPLLPIYKIVGKNKEKQCFLEAYQNSDKLILLSKYYFPVLKKITPQANIDKFAFIGNPVVFDEYYPIEELYKKKKKILVVCSANHVKRIPILLKIWQAIERDPICNDWSFTFVGGGDRFNHIIKRAHKMRLKRITFTGFTSPLPYYKESSIMLMTSKYEGWPMVLMEGQQMGVVPISYNSFESLQEIIDNEKNGIIIPNNNISLFIKKLKDLMMDNEKRNEMAKNAIIKSQIHSKENAINKYINLFNNLLYE